MLERLVESKLIIAAAKQAEMIEHVPDEGLAAYVERREPRFKGG